MARTPGRPLHTYSIVARDPETGRMGGAVQSHWFSVGSVVLWGRAGTGVVATQSIAEVSYGPLGLALMGAGRSPAEALRGLLAADPVPEVRQVAMVARDGRVAAHTGDRCIPMAGHRLGDGFSAQANLMERDTVWDAMARAYESASGDLAERLVAALEAAQEEGGDIRGQQSAALLVVEAEPSPRPWEERVVDLRVEDHPEPVAELRRLLTLHRAYEQMNAGDEAMERDDVEAALRAYSAAEELAPGAEMTFWHAVSLANAGRVDEALPLFRRVFEADRRWADLVPRLAEVDLLMVDAGTLERIAGAAG